MCLRCQIFCVVKLRLIYGLCVNTVAQTSPVIGFDENQYVKGQEYFSVIFEAITKRIVRNGILKTAEIAGHTIKMGDKRHYLLANVALVGESIMLAMRTNFKHH